jgi:hypothetical protein
MKPRFVCALLLFSASVAFAGPAANKVFITSTSKTNQPAKAGEASSEAAAIARQMEVFTAEALSDQFPCSSSLTTDDVGALLNWERQRDLLGNPSPENLAAIAASLGTQTLIDYQVTQIGDRVTVTGTAMSSANGKTLARKTVALPQGDGMVDAMEAFAKEFAGSMGQASPKCKGGWKGTISVEFAGGGTAPSPETHDVLSGNSSLHLDCQVQNSLANCTVTFSSNATTKDSSYGAQVNDKAETSVSIDVAGGKTTIKLGMVTVHGTRNLTIQGMGGESKDEFQFGGWTAEAAGKPGDSVSGSWTDGAGTTISWSLSMK